MEDLIRDVSDIERDDRQALEHLLGQPLRENQRLLIRVLNIDLQPATPQSTPPANGSLPEWCDVYAGLTEEEVADLEQSILTRADLSRPSA